MFLEKGNYFTDKNFQQYKRNKNILKCIPSDTKNFIRAISLEGRLYSQVVMTQNSIINIKGTKKDSVKVKCKNIEISMNYQFEYDKDKNYSSAYAKIRKFSSEATKEPKNKKKKSNKESELTYQFQGNSSISQHWFNIDSYWTDNKFMTWDTEFLKLLYCKHIPEKSNKDWFTFTVPNETAKDKVKFNFIHIPLP